MTAKTIFIFCIVCVYRMTEVFLIGLTQEYNYGKISNLLGPMVHNIASRYFNNSECVCVITEENAIILKYIPKSVFIFHIHIGGIGSPIKEIEDSDTLDSTQLTNDTQKFERLLTETMNAGCESYIVHVRNVSSVIHSFARTTRRARTRYCKQFLYLPITLDTEIIQLKDIFSMKEMNYMPDLIIAKFVNSQNMHSNLIQYGYDKINSKDKHYKSDEIINFNAETSIKFPRNRQGNKSGQVFSKSMGNGVVIHADEGSKRATYKGGSCMEGSNCAISNGGRCMEGSNCATSKGGRCMEGSNCATSKGGRCMEDSDNMSMVANTTVNLCISRSLNKINDNINAIEIVTHKFVGKDPSSEIVLDIWVTDRQHAGFLKCADLFPDKLRNLEGRVVRATTFNYVPFVVLIQDEEIPVYGGFEFLTFMEFAKKLNFTWKLVLDEENFWGAAWPNGSGNGVIGNIATDKAEVGFAAMYLWHPPFLWTDYTTMLTKSGVTCLVPKPKLSPSWLSLWLPFSPGMWAAISVCIITITAFFYVLAKTSSKCLGAKPLDSYATWTNCFLTTLGMFFLQPPPDPQETGHGPVKGFVVAVLVFFLLVSTVYSGGLASVLTVPRYERPIDTVQELADSDLPWVNVHEAWVYSLLDNDDAVSKTLIRHFKVLTEEEMTVLSTQGNTAFPLEKLASQHYSVPAHINETAIRTLRIMKESMYGSHIIMYTRKSSPYKESLNQIISSLFETGIIQYWEGQTIRTHMSERLQIAITQSVVLSSKDGPLKLTLNHLQGAFVMLFFGLVLATISFIVEMAFSKMKQYHSSFKNKFC